MAKNATSPEFIQIPQQVYEDRSLSAVDMLVYGLIYWYSRLKMEKCIASNKRFADILGVTPKKINESIRKLSDAQAVKAVYRDESKRHRLELIPLVVYQRSQIHRQVHLDTPVGVSTDTPSGGQNKNIGNKKRYIAADAALAPFKWDEYLKGMFDSDRDEINVIGYFFQHKGIKFDSRAEASAAISRHLRAAKMVSAFSEEKIEKAFDRAKYEYPGAYTIETVYKILTK